MINFTTTGKNTQFHCVDSELNDIENGDNIIILSVLTDRPQVFYNRKQIDIAGDTVYKGVLELALKENVDFIIFVIVDTLRINNTSRERKMGVSVRTETLEAYQKWIESL